MENEDLDEIIDSFLPVVAAAVEKQLEKQLRKRRRSVWVKSWIAKRPKLGASDQLLQELSEEDPFAYRNVLRLNSDKFEELLQLVAPLIQKKNTTMRAAIPAKLKLEATLRYLATGDSFASLKYLFRLPVSTTSKFIPEVLSAIYKVLQPYIEIPKNENDWKKIQKVFLQRWNFPDCCGSLDGKHIQIVCPKNSGSDFHNYKKTFSIVLFALVDGDYCFRYIDVGANGRASDGAIFKNSSLNIAMKKDSLKMPKDSMFIGDDAFPLQPNLMKPFSKRNMTVPQRIFNYRLSRARRVVENAFGILVARFRIFTRPIDLKIVDTIDLVVQATCALHNWLRMTSPNTYFSGGSVDIEDIDAGAVIPGNWRSQISTPLSSVQRLNGSYDRKLAVHRRNALSAYFVGEGAVSWQWNAVGITSADNCISVVNVENEESDPDDPDVFEEFSDGDMYESGDSD